MSLSSHQSARIGKDEWLTPPDIIAALGDFDLDPCAPVHRPWDTAAAHYTIEDDGLAQPWAGRVWLNPPFGREAVKWMRKMVTHDDGIALLPARTETAMFYETVWPHAAAICFLRGRPHFHHASGERGRANSGAPICLIAYGEHNIMPLALAELGVVLCDWSYRHYPPLNRFVP